MWWLEVEGSNKHWLLIALCEALAFVVNGTEKNGSLDEAESPHGREARGAKREPVAP